VIDIQDAITIKKNRWPGGLCHRQSPKRGGYSPRRGCLALVT
jgi:hypothetical protein